MKQEAESAEDPDAIVMAQRVLEGTNIGLSGLNIKVATLFSPLNLLLSFLLMSKHPRTQLPKERVQNQLIHKVF